MILIIGGAYQGKLDLAKASFSLAEGEIYTCDGGEPDFSKRCIDKLELFAARHPDPVAFFETHREEWRESILIMQDIFCGVVPMGEETRAWRQRAGKLAQYLGNEAQQVIRVFCGLEQRLK